MSILTVTAQVAGHVVTGYLTILPNFSLKTAAKLAQNARSSEPGGTKSIAGGPPEDIRLMS